MQRLVLFGLITFGTAANLAAMEPAADFLTQVAAAVREHVPDATIETEDDRLLAKHDTMLFTLHSRSKTGRVSPDTYKAEGPNHTGFHLEITRQQGEYFGAAQVPQTLKQPYFPTYIDAVPTADGDAHYWVRFSQGSQLDAEVAAAILKALTAKPVAQVALVQPANTPTIMFILDCSGSMSREGIGPFNRTRLNVAREMLTSNLRKLNNETQVGFMLFGHRVGWESGGFQERRFNQKMIAEHVDARLLHPSTDIEVVVPIGRFDQAAKGTIDQKATLAWPWGQTPLYASIAKGLRQFDIDDIPLDVPRHVIVMTDGENDPGPPAGYNVVTAQYLRRMKHRKTTIKLDFVCLDFDPSPELRELAATFGGGVHLFDTSEGQLPSIEKLFPADAVRE